jgi:hypothetical protein
MIWSSCRIPNSTYTGLGLLWSINQFPNTPESRFILDKSDLQNRKGRIDLSLYEHGKPLLISEVKRDWQLTSYADQGALQQVYNYAHEVGARCVSITNGDYYLLRDRLHGLTYEESGFDTVRSGFETGGRRCKALAQLSDSIKIQPVSDCLRNGLDRCFRRISGSSRRRRLWQRRECRSRGIMSTCE